MENITFDSTITVTVVESSPMDTGVSFDSDINTGVSFNSVILIEQNFETEINGA